MAQREKLWTKDFILVSTANFLLFVSFYMMMATLAIYAIEQFKVSNSVAGLASSMFVLGAVLIRPFAGNLIEKIGRKKLLIIGLIIFLVGSVSYLPINQVGVLLLFRFIHGFAFGISTNATSTIAADVIPSSRRGEGMGYFATSMNLGMAVGPFFGLLIMQYLDSKMIFVVTSIFAAVALITVLTMNIPERPIVKEDKATKKKLRLGDFFEKKAMPIAVFMLIIGIANSSILSFISAYAAEIDLVSAATFFFVIYAIVLILSRPITGRLYDQRGENTVMYPSIILFGIGLLVLSQVSNGYLFLLAGALIGVGFGTLQSSAQTIAISQVPHNRVGLATSTFFTLYDVGMGAGPFLLGFIIEATSFRELYIWMSIIAFIGIPLYYYLHGRKAKKQVATQ